MQSEQVKVMTKQAEMFRWAEELVRDDEISGE